MHDGGPVTVGAVVRDRMGEGVLQALVAPVIAGVHSADPDTLDLRTVAPGLLEALVAEENGTCSGYALYYPNYASFRGQKGYYLEDLYVAAEFRGRGVGEAFLREIARRGSQRGFKRIDFQVLGWNAPAIGFYERLGAHRDETERHFKFTDVAFAQLAAG